jgi:tetratricopeptide (TPR) repeat protein
LISILATLGISVLTATVKYLTEDSLGKVALTTLDTIFGGVLGNVSHDHYNRLQQHFSGAITSEQNTDLERCSRDAMLKALIMFSNEAMFALQSTDLAQQERLDCEYCLRECIKRFNSELVELPKLPDSAILLNNNPLSYQKEYSQALESDHQEWRAMMKGELTAFALKQFGYAPEHVLHKQLTVWIPLGVSEEKHWFIFYINALHSNLKNDAPEYCKKSRRILTQTQLADLLALTEENLGLLDSLVTLSRGTLSIVDEINTKVNVIVEHIKSFSAHSVERKLKDKRSKYLNTFAHYDLANLVGREPQLQAIENHFANHSLMLLNGIGGIGKTTLAKAYISKSHERYTHISYVEISGSIAESMLSQLGDSPDVELMVSSEISQEDKFSVLIDTMRHISEQQLLVLDNANDTDDLELRKPQLEGINGKVLITGRAKPLTFVSERLIQEIQALNPNEAFQLFKNHYHTTLTEGETMLVDRILKGAFYHPKLVEVISKSAHENAFLTLDRLAEIVDNKHYDDGEINYPIKIDAQTKKIYRILLDLFDTRSTTIEFRQLLTYFSVLPSVDIHVHDLATLLQINSKEDRKAFQANLKMLAQTGWLDNTDRFYSMHGLVRWVVQQHLLPTAISCQPLITGMANALHCEPMENPLERQRYLPYTVEWLDLFSKESSEELARVFTNISKIYQAIGNLQPSLSYQQKALEIQGSTRSFNDLTLANSLNNLGEAYRALGNYEQALPCHLNALEIREAMLPPMHQDLAISYSNLGGTYRDSGDLKQALHYHKKSVLLLEAVLPSADPNLARSLNNLAKTYGALGDNNNALFYHEEALAILEIALSPTHPDLAASLDNIAGIHRRLGDFQKALVIQQKALGIREGSLSSTHPSLAISYDNLAGIYRDLGDNQQALSYQLKSEAIFETALPPNHPDLAITYNNLGETYRTLGNQKQALSYHHKALKIRKEVLRPTHPDLAATFHNLAITHSDLGEHKLALSYHEQALAIEKAVLPENHPDLATSYCNLAAVYRALGDHEKSMNFNRQALSIRQIALPKNHPHLANSFNELAMLYGDMEDWQQALSLQQKAIAVLEAALPANHPTLGAFFNNLAAIYQALKNYQHAIHYQQKALAIQEEVLPNHLNTIHCLHSLAFSYKELGELEESYKYLRKASTLAKHILASDDPVRVSVETHLERVSEKLQEKKTE